jgi:hypothetical protein
MSKRESVFQRGKRRISQFFGGASPWDAGKARPLRICSLRGFEQLETRRMLHGDDLTGGDETANDGNHDEIPADFSLMDVNQSSPTYQHTLSPRDYLDHVSVWLFGWST